MKYEIVCFCFRKPKQQKKHHEQQNTGIEKQVHMANFKFIQHQIARNKG